MYKNYLIFREIVKMHYKFYFILEWSVLCMNVVCIMGHVFMETKLGILKGTTMMSRNGRKFKAFMGVPYAKPPIGLLRFQVSKIVQSVVQGSM